MEVHERKQRVVVNRDAYILLDVSFDADGVIYVRLRRVAGVPSVHKRDKKISRAASPTELESDLDHRR